MAETTEDILNIFIIGFHHKKGCQIEYSFPPLEPIPEAWNHLPSLAMPDGAHNFAHDTVYFHLPSNSQPNRTVFGVSCFRQIPLEQVKNRTEDMTRSTVQKAVCVLATAPLYGYIQVKLELITAAFFDGGDFSDTKLLEDAFHHLQDCLPGSTEQHLYDGISVKDLLLRFQDRLLVLFKLLLLERKLILFQSPVQPLCSSIMSLVSLLPLALEFSLDRATSPNCGATPDPSPKRNVLPARNAATSHSMNNSAISETTQKLCNSHIPEAQEATEEDCSDLVVEGVFHKPESDRGPTNLDVSLITKLDLRACGLPLEVFRKGNVCYPYLSISYLDHLASPSIRGYVVGASNVLFKQKCSLRDVLVELDENLVTISPELRRILALTTEDLRFMSSLQQSAAATCDPVDDQWIRTHFYYYLITMLRASLLPDGSRELNAFNASFISAWRLTHNFKIWEGSDHSAIMQVDPVHLGSGAMSVSDVKNKFMQAMNTSNGKKLNQVMATTGKAVGGAVNQARGVLSGWWNTFAQEDKAIKSVDHI